MDDNVLVIGGRVTDDSLRKYLSALGFDMKQPFQVGDLSGDTLVVARNRFIDQNSHTGATFTVTLSDRWVGHRLPVSVRSLGVFYPPRAVVEDWDPFEDIREQYPLWSFEGVVHSMPFTPSARFAGIRGLFLSNVRVVLQRMSLDEALPKPERVRRMSS